MPEDFEVLAGYGVIYSDKQQQKICSTDTNTSLRSSKINI